MTSIAAGIVVVLALLAVVAVKVLVNGTTRLVSLAVLVGLGVAVWTQRQALQDCAAEVRSEADLAVTGGTDARATCTFFGIEVTVDLPDR